jgi:hypothetical protein
MKYIIFFVVYITIFNSTFPQQKDTIKFKNELTASFGMLNKIHLTKDNKEGYVFKPQISFEYTHKFLFFFKLITGLELGHSGIAYKGGTLGIYVAPNFSNNALKNKLTISVGAGGVFQIPIFYKGEAFSYLALRFNMNISYKMHNRFSIGASFIYYNYLSEGNPNIIPLVTQITISYKF